MGAGLGSSSLYNTNTNVNTSGGSKKQGLAYETGIQQVNNRDIKSRAQGNSRGVVFYMNQVGGVSPSLRNIQIGGVHYQYKPYQPFSFLSQGIYPQSLTFNDFKTILDSMFISKGKTPLTTSKTLSYFNLLLIKLSGVNNTIPTSSLATYSSSSGCNCNIGCSCNIDQHAGGKKAYSCSC